MLPIFMPDFERPRQQRQPEARDLADELAREIARGQEKQAKAMEEGMLRMNDTLNFHLAHISDTFEEHLSNMATMLKDLLEKQRDKS